RKITHASTEGYEPVSIGTAIQAGFDVVRYKPRFEEIDVRRELPEDLPPLYGDLAQLGECFLNLIDNAYDAILERIERLKPQNYQGRITIKATVEPSGAADRCVAIEVSDNGIGILDKERAQLFTPFFTTKLSSDKGTGLGLYVIKRIIEAHGGAIALASTYGVGTTFTLRLPTSKEPVHSQPSTVHS
ncbi:MAG: hypothetical protein HYZ88_02310, partial [Candidatus Omnitrophica bacterium]|nr:hypothetical protein [Candidatus Omnitrophota bacterium]